jgi:uncharacterized protein (TIGR02231 family)
MRLLLLILVAFSLCGLPGHAITAGQRITAVTVYPDRALVTRSGTVMLPAGIQTVVFDHLPLNLEEDSVRAKAASRTAMKILGIEMRRDYREVAPNADTQKLQDGVTKLDDQIRALTDEQRDLNKRADFLDQIRSRVTSPEPMRGDGKDGDAQNIEALFTMYGAETSKITSRLREIDFSLRGLNTQRAALANQLALLQQPAQPNTRSALVTVDAGSGGAIDMDVTYMISGAAWQPQYDAYADPDTQKVELTYYGVVRQTTGEDWDGVALTLSSSRPSLAARLPDMTPWTVDFASLMTPAGGAAIDEDSSADKLRMMNATAQPTAASATMADAPEPASPASVPPFATTPMADAQIQSLGPAATFIVPAKTTIPSDNQPHRNAISVQNLKGGWTYEASPKLADGAFLKTRVTNASTGPLLGGPINVFLGNDFVGQSNIGLVAANASFDLFLGADDNIKMTRTEGIAREETGGILTRQRVYKRSYVIEVENFKATDIDLQLHDQVPVSKNGDIAVRMDTIEPALQTQNADTGELTWKLKMRPGQKQKFTVEYEVDAPYDKPISGV